MDRRNNHNHLNRNTSNIYNHINSRVVKNNLVTPEIFVSEIWMQEDPKNGVEIIELNSSNSEEATSQEPQQTTGHNFGQAWSFVNNDRFRHTEENYRINEIARERRRKQNEEEFSVASEYLHDHDTQPNFNGFHYIDDTAISGIPRSEQMNCFTILNNHVVHSDSSSDNEYARVEEIESYFAENSNNQKYWDHVYKDDLVSYEPINPSINQEKRTVWIYSFKNQRRLSENNFDLVNITSKDSTDTSSPISDDLNIENSINVSRIASPIPNSYIPRLDLSLGQTLSTVTELSEVTKYTNSVESSKESLVRKPVNNWFTDRTTNKKTKTEVSNVINWMSLSPRERRRRFKNTNSDRDRENQERKEIFTHAEGKDICEEPLDKSQKTSSALIQVDVDVHANDIPDATLADIEIVSVESLELEPKVENNKLSINISYADDDTEIDNENRDFKFNPYSKPRVNPVSDHTYDVITEPIEKLNSSQWIIEEKKLEKRTNDFNFFENEKRNRNDSFRSGDMSDSASKRLWVKNTKLLKSPLWTDYLPITGTPPSLHLSLSLSSIESKKSWFQRIIKYLKCCK